MVVWICSIIVAILLTAFAFVFLYRRMGRFAALQRVARRSLWGGRVLKALPLVAAGILLAVSPTNAAVILIHLMVFWLACDGMAWLVRKTKTAPADGTQDAPEPKPYWAGVAALALTVAYLAYGWVAVHHVQETDYTLATAKPVEPLRVLQISDSHVGALFDGEGFADLMALVQEAQPDVVVFTGDFVDDDTCRADMETAAAALGSLEAPLGVYFVFGNHDKGYYTTRDFTGDDLVAALESAGVTVLQDQVVILEGGYALVGRQDKECEGGRAAIADLLAQVPADTYTIVLDHQPGDYDAETAAGADLVLSGHTHGGQLFPIGPISRLLGVNDAIYGLSQRGATTFIVSSGIADWGLWFKTGTVSEYVVIDIARP